MKNEKNQEVNDQRVNQNGRARLLSVGKFLPKDWGWVRVTRTRAEGETVWLKVERIKISVGD